MQEAKKIIKELLEERELMESYKFYGESRTEEEKKRWNFILEKMFQKVFKIEDP